MLIFLFLLNLLYSLIIQILIIQYLFYILIIQIFAETKKKL